jgi:PAS domain S-box-containing protein
MKDTGPTPLKVIPKISTEELDNFIKAATETLEKKIGELETAKVNLEEKVKERTVELERRTEDLEKSRMALMNILEDTEDSRKTTEEEKNKTKVIINNFTDGLFVFDEKDQLSLINPQAEAYFKVKKEDLISKTISELDVLSVLQPLTSLLKKGMENIFRQEIEISNDSVLEISTVSIKTEEGKSGTLVILHDITREKMIEKMKTEFVSISAHQLRTPLSAIKWTLKTLLDGDLGEISKEQRDFIEKSYQSNERMINLINDLLDVTRIEEGKYLYKPILSNFELVIQFIINSHQDELNRKNLKLEFKKLKTKIPQVLIDVEKIRLAIDNLLENSMRYTPSGGKITITLDYSEEKQEVEFTIQDTGVGIPKDQQSRIFAKFFRGANVIRMETEGSGLGVFLAKNIIEAHGGKIWFESEEGQGTSFYFSLPVKEEFTEFLKKL